jgi:tetratricopeptide (TPR) repeat protein
MSSSSSTTRSKRKRDIAPAPVNASATAPSLPSRRQGAITLGLLGLWLGIAVFGVICGVNPPWLQALSAPGREVEARVQKRHGDEFLRQGNPWAAIACYDAALAIVPDKADARVNLAVARLQTGASAVGIALLEDVAATTANPRLREFASYQLAQAYQRQQDFSRAIACYENAIGFAVPQNVVYRELGTIHMQQGRFAEAHRAFERALAAQQDVTLPYKYMLYSTIDMDAAGADVPDHVRAELDGVMDDAVLARYDFEILRQMQQHDPEIAKTHNRLGALCLRLGEPTAAQRHFQDSLRIWPDNRVAARHLRMIRELAGLP